LIGSGALVTGYFAVAFWTLASERQIKRIRQKFFESVMRQEIGWFDTHESGELSTYLKHSPVLKGYRFLVLS
jgi:ABC-type multidrug transport system fused ATPase/permease subunit